MKKQVLFIFVLILALAITGCKNDAPGGEIQLGKEFDFSGVTQVELVNAHNGARTIITDEKNLDKFLSLVDDPHNGLTFCVGSLGCSNKNDVVSMAAKYAKMGRIHFVHMRNVAVLDNGFEERAHLSSCGSIDMYAVMKALHDNGFTGYVRPDHGRMIWGETGRPGYGLYDRALGATYINGLFEACEKAQK